MNELPYKGVSVSVSVVAEVQNKEYKVTGTLERDHVIVSKCELRWRSWTNNLRRA
jgi:hypothetical protein